MWDILIGRCCHLHNEARHLAMFSSVLYGSSLCVFCRRQNGENKPLTVPKDINLHLEKAPVNTIDALGKNNHSLILTCKCSILLLPADDLHLSPPTFSASLLPGVPVAGGLCRLHYRHLPVHRVLLLRGRCQQRGQHRRHLVCADGPLLPVSFLPWESHCGAHGFSLPPCQSCAASFLLTPLPSERLCTL